MIPQHPQRICKLPATSRLAQLIFASPVMPIQISKNKSENLTDDTFSLNASPYNISSNILPLPDKIYRDIQTRCSHSVGDWLLAASREQSLDDIDRELFNNFRNSIIKIAAAGMNDSVIDSNAQSQLMASCHAIAKKQHIPDWKKISILGVEAQAALNSIQEYATEISNRLIMEEREQSRKGRG